MPTSKEVKNNDPLEKPHERSKRRRESVWKLFVLSRMNRKQIATSLGSKDFPEITEYIVRNDLMVMRNNSRRMWRDNHNLADRIENFTFEALEAQNQIINMAYNQTTIPKKVTMDQSREVILEDQDGHQLRNTDGSYQTQMIRNVNVITTEEDPAAISALIGQIHAANKTKLEILGLVGWTRRDRELLERQIILSERLDELESKGANEAAGGKDKLLQLPYSERLRDR